MADFEVALESLLAKEGGFNPKDGHAGAVNFGITSKFLEGIGMDGSPEVVKSMTRERAAGIYKKHFWDPHSIGSLTDQRLATMLFHMVVNMGPYWPIKYAQDVLVEDFAIPLIRDGIMGPKTVAALESLGGPRLDSFIAAWKELLLIRYRGISKDPVLAQYLKGWEERLAQL